MEDGLLRRENIHEDEPHTSGGVQGFEPVTLADQVLRFSRGHDEVQDRFSAPSTKPEGAHPGNRSVDPSSLQRTLQRRLMAARIHLLM